MSFNEENISIPDQISSRLHRWVQRTRRKVRNEERVHSVKIRENQDTTKANEVDIKKCKLREKVVKNSRASRSYEELEQALKDLVNNCVTNRSAAEEGSLMAHDKEFIHVTRENSNTNKQSRSVNTNNYAGKYEDPFWTSKNCDNVDTCELSSGRDIEQKSENNSPGTNQAELKTFSLSKQNDVTQHDPKEKQEDSSETSEVCENDPNLIRQNEEICEHEKKCEESFNQFSKIFDNLEINISLSNINKGLNRAIDRSNLKASESLPLRQKPPLRRIQSEGDALEMRTCFRNSDVTEFAATCVRHAERKHFSDNHPDVYFSLDHSCILGNNDCLKDCGYSVPAGNSGSNRDLLEDGDTIPQNVPEINLKLVETNAKSGHISLSDRPSSLSFPLETSKHKNRIGPLKNVVSRPSPSSHLQSASSIPRISRSAPYPSRSTPSLKFRRFPCQPVFYVPSNTSRTTPNIGGSVPVEEQLQSKNN